MSTVRAPLLVSVLGAAVIVVAVGPARAQHGQHGAPPMGPTASAPEQVREKIRGAMANADTAMRDLRAESVRLGPGAARDEFLTPMNGMLEQMRQVQGTLGALMMEPGFTARPAAVKAAEGASRDFEQTAKAFQAMTRSLGRVMKETPQ